MAKRKRSDTSQQAAAVVPPVPAQALQGAPAAALQELAMLQSQAAMLSAQLQEVSARALATMQACSQLAATVAGQPAPGAAHDAPAAETANGPRQTSTMPTLMAGFPTLFQQAQQLTTPAWPASAALPPATSSEIQEALQSTSRRREKDKEKKRKRRDMSGSLVKQVSHHRPPAALPVRRFSLLAPLHAAFLPAPSFRSSTSVSVQSRVLNQSLRCSCRTWYLATTCL